MSESPIVLMLQEMGELAKMSLNRDGKQVNTVCLGFSHEFRQFSQSFFFLEFRVKNVFRIKYLESFMYRFMKIYKYVQISVKFLCLKIKKR